MSPPSLLITEFGRARINSGGYYHITSRKEGNHHKLLHRLIFEKFHGPIPQGYSVHHINGIKTDNCILNLELLSINEHQVLHNRGNDELHRKICLARNTTGYRNVSTSKNSHCKQGFTYRYRYYENGDHKAITCVTIEGLREKVLAKGLVWEEFGEVIV